ncbi:MAG: tetratricopeptide repeat protein [Polyangiaceae bacterium]|nr:tetratricopeptide repeat protein [Polyangiaceae bacterium]
MTLGDIARIRVSKGEVEEALRLHHERLAVFEELGDADGIANTLWSIGQIDFAQKRYGAALQRLELAYTVLSKLGRLDGICVVGMNLAPLLVAAKRPIEAIAVLARSREGFLKLGHAAGASQAQELLEAIEQLSANR